MLSQATRPRPCLHIYPHESQYNWMKVARNCGTQSSLIKDGVVYPVTFVIHLGLDQNSLFFVLICFYLETKYCFFLFFFYTPSYKGLLRLAKYQIHYSKFSNSKPYFLCFVNETQQYFKTIQHSIKKTLKTFNLYS